MARGEEGEMKIIIENTNKVVQLNGVPARIWEGETESGVPVICYVNMISPRTHDAEVNARFERELKEVRNASPAAARAYDMRYFID
jgi:hypothetical protein